MKKGKKGVMLAAAAVLAAMMAFPAMAADSVGSVDISIYGTFYLGQTDTIEDFEIDTDTDGCYIDQDSTKFTNEPSDGWTESSKPRLQVVVRIDDTDEYSFSGITKDDIDISCDYDYTLSSSRSGSKLTVTVTFSDVDFDDDDDDDGDTSLELDEDEVVWDDSNNGYGYWEALDYARSYELRIYRNNSRVTTDTLTTTDDYYDFGQYMTKEGDYYFRVRAVHGSNNGSWINSDDIYISDDDAAEIAARVSSSGTSSISGMTQRPTDENGQWISDENGYWWCRNDRTWPADQWEKIGGYWFFFNPDGYAVENEWVQWNSETQSLGSGLWYYLGINGVMMENEWTPDNYWVGNDGVWNGKEPGVQ